MVQDGGDNLVTRPVLPGGGLVLGSCSCIDCRPDLLVPASPGAWFAAAVTTSTDHWRVENRSVDTDIVLTNLEDERQRLRITPQRSDFVVPFEFARLQFVQHGRPVGVPVTAIGHEPRLAAHPVICGRSRRVVEEAALRMGTTYMLVLEELCRGQRTAGVPPSSLEISASLGEHGVNVSRRAVDHHIDYLYRRLFPEHVASGNTHGWKRTAVASLVNQARLFGRGHPAP